MQSYDIPNASTYHVALSRHFRELTPKELEDPEILSAYNEASWSKSPEWKSLLEKKRVVILAAAGSGKTHEMQVRQEHLAAKGKYAFYVPLEELADAPFEDLLLPDQQRRFNEWKAAMQPAWFFLDAVDELKLKQKTLRQALRRMRQAIDGHLDNAHIIISSRPTDWRYPLDEQTFQQAFPAIAEKQRAVATSSGEEMFIQAIKSQTDSSASTNTASQPPQEALHTMLLLPLSDAHVRAFAEKRGVGDSASFLLEISRTNSWLFARRPLDLNDLITHWNGNGSLGTRKQQHESNITSKLRDGTGRPDSGHLSDTLAREGAERLALAMALTRTRSVKSPDNEAPSEAEGQALDSADILPDWTPEQRSTLLRRALFDPATLGRVRFHHRSVQEYLAASRLNILCRKGMCIKTAFGLLFAEKYGEQVVLPSMRPIVAWLAIENESVRQQVISCEPNLLLELGDPASLSVTARGAVFEAIVRSFGTGSWRGLAIPLDQIERAAHPELAPCIIKCWGNGPENAEVRDLLLDLIWKSKASACLPIARKVVTQLGERSGLRSTAVKIMSVCSSETDLRLVAQQIHHHPDDWPPDLVSAVLECLFPKYLGLTEVIPQLEREDKDLPGEFNRGFVSALYNIVENKSIHFDRQELRRRLTNLLICRATHGEFWNNVHCKYEPLCAVIAQLCLLELDVTGRARHAPDLLRSCVTVARLSKNDYSDFFSKPLRKKLTAASGLRGEIFWEGLKLADELIEAEDSWKRFYNAYDQALLGRLEADDEPWLAAAIQDNLYPHRHEVAVHGLVQTWIVQGRERAKLPSLKAKFKEYPDLVSLFDERIKQLSEAFFQEESFKEQQSEDTRKSEENEVRRVNDWIEWRNKLLENPHGCFSPEEVPCTIGNLGVVLNGLSASANTNSLWNYQTLTSVFKKTVADLARTAFKKYWREQRPLMWSERKHEERNSTPWVWIYGLSGVVAEAEAPGWAESLTSEEARLAARYATVEINSFPSFLSELALRRPTEVDEVLGGELEAELLHGGACSYLPILQKLKLAGSAIEELLAPRLFRFFEKEDSISLGDNATRWVHNLDQIIDALISVLDQERLRKMGDICSARFSAAKKGPLAFHWLRGVFCVDSLRGIQLVLSFIKTQQDEDAVTFVINVLSGIFSTFNSIGVRLNENESRAEVLAQLVRCAYKYVKVQDDTGHSGKRMQSTRSEAEHARSRLMGALIAIPGADTHKVLLEFSRETEFAHMPDWLKQQARGRAAQDAEFEAWQAADLVTLEKQYELPPHDRDTLHQMMMHRLEDLQHDLDHDDLSDRAMIATIKNETDMQISVAQKLKAKAHGMYQVTREEEVSDGKKPDIRLLSISGMVKAAIEIKIADARWSLKDFEKALTTQLTKQYLRHESCRSGCLLLTYNGTFTRWNQSGKDTKLTFLDLINHLQRMAVKIEKENNYTIKIAVFGLDLTGCYLQPTTSASHP